MDAHDARAKWQVVLAICLNLFSKDGGYKKTESDVEFDELNKEHLFLHTPTVLGGTLN